LAVSGIIISGKGLSFAEFSRVGAEVHRFQLSICGQSISNFNLSNSAVHMMQAAKDWLIYNFASLNHQV